MAFPKPLEIGYSIVAETQNMRVKWARKYMKLDMKHVLFTDATLDGPNSRGKGWVFKGDKNHPMFRRQQSGGGLMIWAGIIDNTIVGPVRIPEVVNLTTKTYYELLDGVYAAELAWRPACRLKVAFMHNNVTSHSSKATTGFLASLGVKDDSLMDWPACLPD